MYTLPLSAHNKTTVLHIPGGNHYELLMYIYFYLIQGELFN